METALRALTVLPPWSWWIASVDPLAKDVENRRWRPSKRALPDGSRIAIHSGVQNLIGERGVIESVRRIWPEAPVFGPCGAVVATAAVFFTTQCKSPWAFPGEWNWELHDKIVLPTPVPCRGHQGLWKLPPAVAEAVIAQEAEARGRLALADTPVRNR